MATAVTGARELVAQLTEGAAAVNELMAVVVEKTAHDLVAMIQIRASGRPGPNTPTGDYRASWSDPGPEPVMGGLGIVSFSVGTDRPQAARLEYGFVGADSLGREYDQDPLPHMNPAVDEIDPIFQAAMAKVPEVALRW